jgi:4-hydroxybenzoate polyprenyltransferase
MSPYQKYTSFVKIEHTLFSLPLLFAGAFLAHPNMPSFRLIVLMVLAGLGARTVALALNRIIDRELDRLNPRTQSRHLATGSMKLVEAWVIAFVGLAIYLWAAWVISDFCFKLSWIPLVGFAAYPFFKRFTKWTHLGLGVVWSLIPLAGYVAVKASFEGVLPVLVLSVFSLFWLAGFDIIYATLDEEFDRMHGLFSLPSMWGRAKALKMAGFFHFLAFICLGILYGVWLSGPITVMLLTIVAVLLILEQKFSTRVDVAFLPMNAVTGFVVMFFVLAGVKGF